MLDNQLDQVAAIHGAFGNEGQRRHFGVAVVVALAAVVCTACQSLESAHTGPFVSVEVTAPSSAEVKAAVRTVMRENGFSEGKPRYSEMVFERPGTRADAIKYGGWLTEGVWERLRVSVRLQGGNRYRVDADAFMVEDKDQGLFESERRLLALRRGRYQELLDKVTARLAVGTAAE